MSPPSVVFTDLDGTLLTDGRLVPAARRALDALRRRGIPVVPLTSKTEAELRAWLLELDCGGAGAFENGAGLVTPSGVEILPGAIPVEELQKVLGAAQRAGNVGVTTLAELPAGTLQSLTGLDEGSLAAARSRGWDLPFLADAPTVDALRGALARSPHVRLTAGGTFWHLTGRHDKGGAARRILERLEVRGSTAGLGDAPNDLPFLAEVDVPVIVPGPHGANARLTEGLPGALVAPALAGEGWACAIETLLSGPPSARKSAGATT
ncbi:MAG: hypothetical protein ABI768_08470 [Acidobacteriota bacterium]